MKIKNNGIEFYKWTPLLLIIMLFVNAIHNITNEWIILFNILFLMVIMIPFIHYHAMVCRHIYKKCKKEEGYEL